MSDESNSNPDHPLTDYTISFGQELLGSYKDDKKALEDLPGVVQGAIRYSGAASAAVTLQQLGANSIPSLPSGTDGLTQRHLANIAAGLPQHNDPSPYTSGSVIGPNGLAVSVVAAQSQLQQKVFTMSVNLGVITTQVVKDLVNSFYNQVQTGLVESLTSDPYQEYLEAQEKLKEITEVSEVRTNSDGSRSYVNSSGDSLWDDRDYVGTHATETEGSRTTTRVEGGYTHDVTSPTGGSVSYTESEPDPGGRWGGMDIPVILDLDGNGVEIEFGAEVFFDVDSDGYREKTTWVSRGDGFLVIDLNPDGTRGQGDGKIHQSKELIWGDWLGSVNSTDLQILSVLEKLDGWGDGNGVLNSEDEVWDELRIWQDLDQDGETIDFSGVHDQNELRTLDHWGISEINLAYDDGTDYDDTSNDIIIAGNTLHGLASYTKDGETVTGGVGDVGLSNSELGWRRIETEQGYTIEFESGGEFHFAELDGSGSPDILLDADVLDGAFGDSRSNRLDASGHSRSVQISGGDENDSVWGGNNDDMLSGDAGADDLRGYGGNDLLFADAEDLENGNVSGGSGYDTLVLSGNASVTVSLANHTVEAAYGAAGNDTISGEGLYSDLLISSGGGDDIIYGGDGNDHLSGENGGDSLSGKSGDDFLYGGSGDDTLKGGNGDDFINGGGNQDHLYGENGDDFISGGSGKDTIFGGEHDDLLLGGGHDDILDGGNGDDTLRGAGGDDTLYTWRGDDLLEGGSGDDVFHVKETTEYGGASVNGWAVLQGGTGNDTAYIDVPSGRYSFQHVSGNQWQITWHDPSQDVISVIDLLDIETLEFSNGVTKTLSTDTSLNTKDDYVRWHNNVWRGDGSTYIGADGWYYTHGAGGTVTGGPTMYGWTGNDTLSGNNGNNSLDGNQGRDVLVGNGGNDILRGSSGSDQISGDDGNDVLGGGSGSDLLDGGNGNDTIEGNQGADLIWGGTGDDRLDGDSGSDTITGQDGLDTIYGNDGADLLFGENGDDALYGGIGADVLSGGSNNDLLEGGYGSDQLDGGTGDDTLKGDDGFDVIHGEEGNDSLEGGNEDDWLYGGDGVDTLRGGSGRDILHGGVGGDLIDGGSGILDVASYEGSDAAVVVNLSTGAASGGHATGDTISATESLVGSDHADSLTGNDIDNTLEGGKGNDTLYGEDGHDNLVGGEGNDSIVAGNGNDRVWGGIGADVAHLGDGNDQFFVSDDSDNPSADTVYGDGGSDEVYGGGGSDVLHGGLGSDFIKGGDGADSINGNAHDDTIRGEGGADKIWGGSHDDALLGGSGNDTLIGGGGADTLRGGTGADTLTGGSGADEFVFDASSSNLGADLITDFVRGTDVLKMKGVGYSDLTFSGTGGGVRVEWDGGSVKLEGVNKSSITQDDFLFV